MRNWKRQTRYRHKRDYFIWLNSESSNHNPKIKLSKKKQKRNSKNIARREAYIRHQTRTKLYYEDCSYHPCLITHLDIEGGHVEGVSLVDGSSPRSCSLHCCGVVFFTQEEAYKRVNYIKEHGWDNYFMVMFELF